MRARSGILNFFLIGGIGFTVVGVFLLFAGGTASSITGGTFTMIGVIWTVVALGIQGFYRGMYRRTKAERELFETGKKATAVVESVATTGIVLNRVNQQIILRLRVQPQGEPEFPYERKMFVPLHGIPRTGDLIEVAYDPKDKSKLALAIDWRTDTAGGRLLMLRRPRESNPMAAGMQPGAAPPFATGGTTAGDRVIEQLERLERLRQSGALTFAEFETQKARILSGREA